MGCLCIPYVQICTMAKHKYEQIICTKSNIPRNVPGERLCMADVQFYTNAMHNIMLEILKNSKETHINLECQGVMMWALTETDIVRLMKYILV